MFGICQGSAWAHANAGVDSIDIIGDGNGALAGIETTVGYLRPQEDGLFQWLCHETVTQTDSLITPQYEENINGTMLVHVGDLAQAIDTAESLYRSEDGCSWHAPMGLTGQQIAAKAFDPHESQRGLALTANEDGINAVYITTDEGQSWTPTTLSTESGTFESVRYSRGIEGVVWASSVNQTASAGWVHRSDDGGLNWTTHPIEGEADSDRNLYITILEADASDPNTAWVVVGPFLDDTLMRTTDGGATFTGVYEPNADIVDGAQDADGGLWLTLTGNKVIHSEDGDVFKRVNDAPLSLGLETLGNRVVLATRVQSEGTLMAERVDGDSFAPIDTFGSLSGPPTCSEGSQSQIICDPLWDSLGGSFSGAPETDTDTGEPDGTEPGDSGEWSSPKTGCCSAEGSQATAGLLGLALLFRRRRPTGFTHPS